MRASVCLPDQQDVIGFCFAGWLPPKELTGFWAETDHGVIITHQLRFGPPGEKPESLGREAQYIDVKNRNQDQSEFENQGNSRNWFVDNLSNFKRSNVVNDDGEIGSIAS